MIVALFQKQLNKRNHSHKLMMMKLRQLCGVVNQETSEGVGFDYAAFMAERESCSRNSAITYFMRECGVLPRSDSVEVKGLIQINSVSIFCSC